MSVCWLLGQIFLHFIFFIIYYEMRLVSIVKITCFQYIYLTFSVLYLSLIFYTYFIVEESERYGDIKS